MKGKIMNNESPNNNSKINFMNTVMQMYNIFLKKFLFLNELQCLESSERYNSEGI